MAMVFGRSLPKDDRMRSALVDGEAKIRYNFTDLFF